MNDDLKDKIREMLYRGIREIEEKAIAEKIIELCNKLSELERQRNISKEQNESLSCAGSEEEGLLFPELSRGTNFVIEWKYGYAGGFHNLLADTICHADTFNRARLKLSFPNEVDAMNNYMNVPGWWEEVVKKMEEIRNERRKGLKK